MDTSNEFKEFLNSKMYIGVPISQDLGDKFALVGMICFLTNALKQKNPNINHYQVIRLCCKDFVPGDLLVNSLTTVCDWWSYQCTKFPDFGLKAKDMPKQIGEQIKNLLPF